MIATNSTGVLDLTFAEYHALPGWGSSSLRAMRRGPPARVMWEREYGHHDTDATILGSAVHCALLTPHLYSLHYAVKPEGMNFSTKDGKAWRDDPIRAGRTILSYGDGARVEAIVGALMAKTAVRESLEEATGHEVSLVWDCSITGERCKGRPDWMERKFGYDLKVSRHASSGYLALRAFSDGWMHQAAHYRTGAIELGLPVRGWRLVVVDPQPPHFVFCLEVKVDALDLLEIENIETVKRLRECRESCVWPGTPDEWTKIEPPASANMDAMNDVVLGEGVEENEEAEANA